MLFATIIRDLGQDDAIQSAPSESKAPALRRVSERHRRLARMIADGIGETDAAIACGYTRSRVSILKADPAFRELVLFYRAQVDEHYVETHDKLALMTNLAVDEMTYRLEETPDEFTKDDLRKLIETGADRIGFSPKTAGGGSTDVTFNLAVRLQEAYKRVQPAIEGTAKRIEDE